MGNFEKLTVWQDALDLTQEIFSFIDNTSWLKNKFWLIDQIQRSSVSIPSNIAEGADRSSQKEFLHFLSIAKGSCAELKTQMILCQRILKDWANGSESLLEKIDVIHKKITSLQKAISRNSQPAAWNI